MSVARGILVAAALVVAAEQPPGAGPARQDADRDPWRVETPARTVRFGEPFSVTVVRRWPRGHRPDPFRDEALDPLVVRRLGAERSEADGVVEERLEFQARAFLLEDLEWPERGLALAVVPRLDPEAPGPVELPGPLLPVPGRTSPLAWLLGGGLLLLAGSLGWWRLRRRPAPAPGPQESPWESARRVLGRLQQGCESPDRDLRTEADLLRSSMQELLDAGLDVPARARTTEEILRHPALQGPPLRTPRRQLETVLTRCDRLRYAAPPGRDPGWSRVLAEWAGFLDRAEPVTATRAAAPEDPP